jgi:membrane-associated phospholipid phosphatase
MLEWSCPGSFGFPSGHSWYAVLFYEPIISDFIGSRGKNKYVLVFVLMTGLFVPLSRLYLGSHSLNQVVYGLFNSLCFLVLYRYILQKSIYKLFVKFLQGKIKRKMVIMISIMFGVAVLTSFIIYSVNINHRKFSNKYLAEIYSACNKKYSHKDI